ncbi:MAG: hypothetical protein ED557_03020 [Balneola sp.]|nr:MAG: hypothetical protein ED557_03020 [Balneola sp.]
MKKSTFFIIAAIILFILNGILIALVLQKPAYPIPQEAKQGELKLRIGEQLNLSEQQVQDHRRLADEHFRGMRRLTEQQKRLARDYFSSLSRIDANSSDTSDVLDEISELEAQKIQLTYEHLNDIKSLLDEDQLPLFDSILDEILKVMLNDQKNAPPPPRQPRDR